MASTEANPTPTALWQTPGAQPYGDIRLGECVSRNVVAERNNYVANKINALS